jgi:hypothetical protein
MIKEYIKYLQNNPEKLWFKRKLYGWGWTPATWQGWVSVGVFLVTVFLLSFRVEKFSSTKEVFVRFVLPVLILTVILLVITYKKGEKPRWQWGLPRK